MLRKNVAQNEKVDAVTMSTLKCRVKKRGTAGNKWVVALKTEFVQTKISHARLVDTAAQSNLSKKGLQTKLNDLLERLCKLEKRAQLVIYKLGF